METISFAQLQVMLANAAARFGTPSDGAFELTPLCNLDCKMCYVHLQDPSVRERMLSGDQWIDLIGQAIDMGMTSAILTGGEAMTHPDFWKIYHFLCGKGVAVVVKTNGILLNPENIAKFVEYPPMNIHVSLYGCNSESYVAVTGHDVFKKVTDNLRAAMEAGLRMGLSLAPSVPMAPWQEEIFQLAKSFHIPTAFNADLFEANDDTGRSREDYALSIEDTIRVNRLAATYFPQNMQKNFEKVHKLSENLPKVDSKPQYSLPCQAGTNGFAIHWDGHMGPCLNTPRGFCDAWPLRDGFAGAWQSLTEQVKAFRIPEACRSCKLYPVCQYCPAAHGKYAVEGKCSPDVCKYKHELFLGKRQ